MKNCLVEAQLFLANGQTDRHHEVLVAFRSFANGPKITALPKTEPRTVYRSASTDQES